MAITLRPWTFVLSEYLDLPFMLRAQGEQVVSVRSAREALEYLSLCCPTRIVVDTDTFGADHVLRFAQQRCAGSRIEGHEQVISRLLAV